MAWTKKTNIKGPKGAATGEKGDEFESVGDVVRHLFAAYVHTVSPLVGCEPWCNKPSVGEK
jgi:hypothetical protein